MNCEHLTDWEIDGLIIAAREESREETAGNAAWRDMEDCPNCKSKVDRLDALLRHYREAALLRTENLANEGPRPSFAAIRRTQAHSFFGLWRWGLAFLLLLAVLFPVLNKRRQESRAAQIAKDNLLLERVDQEVSQSVPDPLQSLTNLVVAGERAKE